MLKDAHRKYYYREAREEYYKIEAALQALRKLGDTRAVDPLIDILLDQEEPHFVLFGHVAWALGKLGDPRATSPLIHCLYRGDIRNSHNSAAEALGELGDPRAIEPLAVCLSSHWLGRSAAAALCKLGDAGVERLIESLKSQDPSARESVVWAFEQVGTPKAAPSMIACLDDPDCDVREGAARALGNMSDNKAVEPLMARLNDSYLTVRKAAANAIGTLLGGPPPEYSLVEKHEPLTFEIALLGCPRCKHRAKSPIRVAMRGDWRESRVSLSRMEYQCTGTCTCPDCGEKLTAYFQSRKRVAESDILKCAWLDPSISTI